MTGSKKSSGYVQSIERAMSIIEILDERGELGISEMSNLLSLERSTVHRIVSTLKGLGYVNQNQANHKYSNSFKLFEIGNNVVKSLGLRKQAMPFMRELSEKTNEAVNLAVMDGKYVIYIDKIESQSTIKVDLSIGKRMPSYCTGLGKIMLAYMPEHQVRALLQDEPFIRFTENTVTNFDELLEHLVTIRQQGYCIDNEEYVEGLFCVAAPVWGHSGEVFAALSVAVPKFLYADTERLIAIRDLVIDVAKRFSTTLGYKS
ncbi:MAG: IclR family transcriptional regulator [Aminobacterium sp.]|uniref:IclR family transcriptional regulator n=1 Tax=unclassified Aminobacterium TaxID=2685012 RepID=UPI001BCAB5B5|nr:MULTISPECIES: IclR family transcriptional regulator [unclassified Aminobacterium]MDD2206370.1 IclR family transcriptional regulator [Aminobacterium sp.]MDD3426486.1 IclR family transcriptional regulator [Aminobacterium sp.]MDD3707483.1 IclR family transcriptional regulator [Aminobacterium sp.]MDD4228387.1 IclR family transcriptional regulator [Aminobacterium sp.]MDD4552283.1 IclR family transcriptional regulator [Aminobacterium sp.]